jgi:hypothetical protein
MNRAKAPYLNEIWGIGAAQARYREDGSWYASLSSFPAALIDAHGYVRFETKQDYLNSPHLSIGKQITVPKRISAIPGYVVKDESDETARLDVNELRARHRRATTFIESSIDLI